jgi:predicted metallopeptidase
VRGFDYTAQLSHVVADVARTLDAFAHVRADEVLVTFGRSKGQTPFGLYARVVPLGVGQYHYRGRPYRYLMAIFLPRFHDQPLEDKVLTIVHELYHLSPRFDGRLRVVGGVPGGHGPSRRAYDEGLRPLARRYLELRGDASHLAFLKIPTNKLFAAQGPVRGLYVRMPRW